MRAKTLILIMIAMCCGLLATIGISQVIDRNTQSGPVVETDKIFVAAADIDIGDAFTADNVQLEEWPRDRVPDGAIRKIEDFEGRFARQRLYAGEPVMTMKLMDSNSDTTMTIPEGYRACSIKVSGEVVVGNLVKPGDRVDVIVFLRRSGDVPITGTRTILRDVRIFAVNSKTEREVDEQGQVTSAQTVSLLVTPKQVELLTLASQLGQLRLSLRRPNDELESEDGGTTVESFLDSGAYAAAPTTEPPSSAGGLLDMLRNVQVPAAAPTAATAPALATEPSPATTEPSPVRFSMMVHSPRGMTRYDWQDEGQLPSAMPVGLDLPQVPAGLSNPLTPSAPTSEENQDNSADSADSEESGINEETEKDD